MERRIINVESTSVGKTTGHNDDDIYIGENFAAVFDGVSNKSSIEVDGKKIKVANIITEALKKIDGKNAPEYAKTLTFDEFVRYINMYIRKYCEHIGIDIRDYQLESTGAIYSKYHNQIWIVGDCRAVYDGNMVSNDLKIDDVYVRLRLAIIEELLKSGYTEEDIAREDVSKKIIERPQDVAKYVTDSDTIDRINKIRTEIMRQALIDSGFSETDIEEKNLLSTYYNPIELQQYLKNNKNAESYGYSVFNGINTPLENCIVQNLPQDVKNIRLSSDGFPIEVLKDSKDLGQAIRKIRKLAKSDPLSIYTNKSLRSAIRQSVRDNILAIDDASAVSIKIEYTRERDDER